MSSFFLVEAGFRLTNISWGEGQVVTVRVPTCS